MTRQASPESGRDEGGWTGGQYSVYRVLLAAGLARLLAERLALVSGQPAALLVLGLVGCLLLALGWRDRGVAALLFGLVATVVAFVDGAPLDLPRPGTALAGVLLLLHVCVPPAPFGAVDARGRIDPRGDWRRPRWLGGLAWGVLAIVVFGRALSRAAGLVTTPPELAFAGLAALGLAVEAGLVLAGLARGLRPRAWLALVIWHVAWLAAFGPEPGQSMLVLLMLFAAEPRWLPGRSLGLAELPTPPASQPAVLYYDGDCGFCHRSVRVVLAEEAGTPPPLRLRFAPLGSDHFTAHVAARPDVDPAALPDSIVLLLEDARLLTRSAAALEIGARLGGLWRILASVLRHLPARWLDGAYDAIARVRKRLFAAPNDACPILPPDLRARFEH